MSGVEVDRAISKHTVSHTLTLSTVTGSWALSARTGPDDPSNQRGAYQRDKPGWQGAEKTELGSHAKNKSWTDIDRSKLPAGRRLVKFTWVYKKKRNGKLKAHLCVQGCTQVPGVDFDQTHCATMRSSSLRVLCAVGAGFGLRMRRWDFASAYLQGSLLDGCGKPRMERGGDRLR
eukprot:5476454-Prymnesium_polylepis.1